MHANRLSHLFNPHFDIRMNRDSLIYMPALLQLELAAAGSRALGIRAHLTRYPGKPVTP